MAGIRADYARYCEWDWARVAEAPGQKALGLKTSAVILASNSALAASSHISPLANQRGYQNDYYKLVVAPSVSDDGIRSTISRWPFPSCGPTNQ